MSTNAMQLVLVGAARWCSKCRRELDVDAFTARGVVRKASKAHCNDCINKRKESYRRPVPTSLDAPRWKRCTHCERSRPGTEFWVDKTRMRLQPWCKGCAAASSLERGRTDSAKRRARDLELRKKFGISLAEYDEMFVRQGGCCAVCGGHRVTQKFNLSVDHNHSTGAVRDLLCGGCNLALGHVKDSVATLRKMIAYLERHAERGPNVD